MEYGNDKAIAAIKCDDSAQERRMRILGILFLHYECDWDVEDIIEAGCTICANNIKGFFTRFYDRLVQAIQVFGKGLKKIKKVITNNATPYWCYIDKITLPNGEEWTKVGTTSRWPEVRASEFEWKINGRVVRPAKVEVLKRFNCKDAEAMETLENALRYAMMSINILKFKMNDRLLDYKEGYADLIFNHPSVQENLADLVTP